jgi:hypothetical protein
MTSALSIEGPDGEKWTGSWVYKIQAKNDELSGAARTLEKWKTITGLPAYLVESGIIVPYLGDCPASDEEIAEALFDIYARVRTVVFDAAGSGGNFNFVKWKGKAICIDFDLAVRRGSRVSEEYFLSSYPDEFDVAYLRSHKVRNPMTVSVVKALLLLDSIFPNDYIADEVKRRRITSKLLFLLRAGVSIEDETLIEMIRIDTANASPESLASEFPLRRITDVFQNIDAINVALKLGNSEMVVQLQEAGAIPHTPLFREIFEKGRPTLEMLAKKIRILNQQKIILDDAGIQKLSELIGFDRKNEIPNKLLGNFLEIKRIKAPFRDRETHVIHLAILYNMPDLVRELVTDNPSLVNTKDNCNKTPLMLAVSKGYHEIVASLISQGADIYYSTHNKKKYKNWTALNYAFEYKHTTCVAYLVAAIVATQERTPVLKKDREKILSIFTEKLNKAHLDKKPLRAALVEDLFEESIDTYIEGYQTWRLLPSFFCMRRHSNIETATSPLHLVKA